MGKLFDKQTIFDKLKTEAAKKLFNMNPKRGDMAVAVPTIVELLEVIAIVLNDILVADNSMPAEITGTDIKLNMGGALKGAARKDDEITIDMTTDSTFMSFIEALYSALSAPIPEAGHGAPSAFQRALKAALAPVKPSKLVGKITKASDKVKIS